MKPGHTVGGAEVGTADVRLAAALGAWKVDQTSAAAAEVYAAFVDARVFVAIAATRGSETPPATRGSETSSATRGGTEIALLTLVGSSGDRALPVFLDVGAAVAFRPGARPLPLPGRDACTAARDDGAVALLLDLPGAHFPVSGVALVDLAAGRVPVAGTTLSFRLATELLTTDGADVPPTDPALVRALAAALRTEPVRAARLLHGPDGPVLGLVPEHPLDAAALTALAARVLPRLAGVLPAAGLDVAVVPPDGPGSVIALDRFPTGRSRLSPGRWRRG